MASTLFKNLPLSNAFMFGEVMRRDESICKLFLEELLGCKIAKLKFINKEYDLADTKYNHGIRLDVYLADANNTHYDIEMQNSVEALERRCRYYQAGIDRRTLEKNAKYRDLPESYIIFVCNYDPYKLGYARYERVMYIKDTDLVYDDGSHVIFLNTHYTEAGDTPKAITEYLDYARDNDDHAPFTTELAREAVARTQQIRRNTEKEDSFMTFTQLLQEREDAAIEKGRLEGREEGRVEGREEGRQENLAEVVATMLEQFSVKDIAAILKKPESVIQEIVDKISGKK